MFRMEEEEEEIQVNQVTNEPQEVANRPQEVASCPRENRREKVEGSA